MTRIEKEKITALRHQGLSYQEISDALQLSLAGVKSFCWRNKMSEENPSIGKAKRLENCLHCGVCLTQQFDSPRRKFCSDHCRYAWWGKHRKPSRNGVCTFCQQPFSYHGKKTRKYCCHPCFIKDRFGEVSHDERTTTA